MKLVIISNMAHYRRGDTIVGHGATARELDALASLFTEVRHVACLHDEVAPASALPYRAPNITLVPVPPAGGSSVAAKLDIVRRAPLYVRTMARELRDADVLHVRSPANITLYAFGLLMARREPTRRWIKYAGNWQPAGPEPLSYRIQREWLASGKLRARVTVNGSWPDQPSHVVSFANPCLTDSEVDGGAAAAASKSLTSPARLLFVGHLGAAKNPSVAIGTAIELIRRGHAVELDVVGEGDERAALERDVAAQNLSTKIRIHGPLPRDRVDELYARAHFVVLPSRTEGWPKVLAEGMAFGAVPVASAVGSIPETLAHIGSGVAVREVTNAAFADAIERYLREPARWEEERDRGLMGARAFTYGAYLQAVQRLLDL